VRRQLVQDLLLGLIAGCLLAACAVLLLLFLLANAPLEDAPAQNPQHATTYPAPRR
jgi:hypothetical protein